MKGIAFVILLLLGACTYPDHARMALEHAGYNHIIMTGYRNNGCQDNELYPVGFRAIKDGHQISGVACEGTEAGMRIVQE